MKSIAIILAASALVVAPPAAAQDAVMALNPTLMVGTTGTYATDNGGIRRRVGARLQSRRAAVPVRGAPAGRLTFRVNPAIRQQVHSRAVAQLQRVNAGEAAKLRQILASGSLNREANGYLAKYGMSQNNLADTTALYLALASIGSRGSNGTPTRAQMVGLRNQLAASMFATPEFARASDATKQELSEANIVQAGLLSSLANEAARNPSFAPTARNAIVQGAKATYGINLLPMNLTNQGLR